MATRPTHHRGASGPGAGLGHDRDPDRTAMLVIRIVLVATVIVGQLWALTLILDSWLKYEDGQMWLLVGFEALSFAIALAIWLTATDR
jgi:hypothetical protein